MGRKVTPVVMSEDGARHEPMKEGGQFEVESIPVSTSRLNLLEEDATGLLITGANIVSAQEHNPAIVNVDGRIFVRLRDMLSPEDKVLKVADNLMRADLSLRFDPETCELSLVGKDRAVIDSVELPASPGVPTVVEILQDTVPPKPEGFTENPYKKGTYLHMRFKHGSKSTDIYLDMTKLVDVYEGGAGITVQKNVIAVNIKEGGGLKFDTCCDDPLCPCEAPLVVDRDVVLDGLVNPDDTVLSVAGGQINSTVRLVYEPDIKTITLLGKDNAVLGAVSVADMGITGLGLPTSVDFVDDPAGYEPGKYLHLQFTLESGEVVDLYLNVTVLVDAYTAGSGITIVDGVVSANLAPTLTFAAGAIAVNPAMLVAQGEQVLYGKSSGLGTRLGLDFVGNKIVLTGVNNAVVGAAQIPFENFVLPEVAEVLTSFSPPPAHGSALPAPQGTYLHLHYDLPAASEQDVYIDLTRVAGEAGPGITIKDGTVSLNIGEAKGLILGADGALGVNTPGLLSVSPDNVLGVDGSGNLLLRLADIIEPGGALVVNGNGKLDIDMSKINAPVSSDSGNILKTGSDSRPYFPADLGNL